MIYIDYQSSTPIDPRVLEAMTQQYLHGFGNASSNTHAFGDRAAAAVKGAAGQVARLVGACFRAERHHPVIFTSGSTEAINLALKGYVARNPNPQHLQTLPGLRVNGDQSQRLPGNLHISIPGINNAQLVAWVRDQLAIATGSACSAGVEAPSHVLQAIGLSRAEQAGALRLSLGKWTTPAEVQTAGSILLSALAELC